MLRLTKIDFKLVGIDDVEKRVVLISESRLLQNSSLKKKNIVPCVHTYKAKTQKFEYT